MTLSNSLCTSLRWKTWRKKRSGKHCKDFEPEHNLPLCNWDTAQSEIIRQSSSSATTNNVLSHCVTVFLAGEKTEYIHTHIHTKHTAAMQNFYWLMSSAQLAPQWSHRRHQKGIAWTPCQSTSFVQSTGRSHTLRTNFKICTNLCHFLFDPAAAFISEASWDEQTFCFLSTYHAFVCVCLPCRDAIEDVGSLYNQVDELVHKLVMQSNKCTQELEFIMEFKSLEEGFREVRANLHASDLPSLSNHTSITSWFPLII